MGTCSQCTRRVQARGFCGSHYTAWWRENNTLVRVCVRCETNYRPTRGKQKYCTPECQRLGALVKARPVRAQQMRDNAKPKPPKRTPDEIAEVWRAQRSDIRAAYEDADWPTFLVALRARCKITEAGCWEWQGRTHLSSKSKSGYPIIRWGGKTHMVHRISLEASHGVPLGTQHAHHICANTICVNPDHLEGATHAENIAEMKARKSYEKRIEELEEALRELDPLHPVLGRIRYGRTA